ncbi:hypothetical protein PIB30_013119 [Stylosanthes scabra]|uniref:Uncharacterized protein n=1 Tax=Stylosanthes scabra TaxID=79078 RepID=A0ABU6W5Q5_9FABA|nr:hypothetical protein [Stylosanthes scabra]
MDKGKQALEASNDAYGPWMLVQKDNTWKERRKIGEDKQQVNARDEGGRNVVTKGNTSRFAVLHEKDTKILETTNNEALVVIVSNDKRGNTLNFPQTPPPPTTQKPTTSYNNPVCPKPQNPQLTNLVSSSCPTLAPPRPSKIVANPNIIPSQPSKTIADPIDNNMIVDTLNPNPNHNPTHHQENWAETIMPSTEATMEVSETPPLETGMVFEPPDPKPPDDDELINENLSNGKQMACDEDWVIAETPLQGEDNQCN